MGEGKLGSDLPVVLLGLYVRLQIRSARKGLKLKINLRNNKKLKRMRYIVVYIYAKKY